MWSRVSLPSSTDTCTLLFTCSAVRSAPARQTRQHSVFSVFTLTLQSTAPKNSQIWSLHTCTLKQIWNLTTRWTGPVTQSTQAAIFPVTLHNTYLKFSLLQTLFVLNPHSTPDLLSAYFFSFVFKLNKLNNGISSHTDKITLLVVLQVSQFHINIVTVCHS